MEYPQIIDVLDVSLLKVQREVVLLAEEVKSVECLSLGLGDVRNARASREAKEACE